MTDLTDDALDKLVARLTWAAGIDQAEYPFPLCNEAAAVITALRQREAEAVAGAKAEGMREAASMCTAVIGKYNVMKPDGETYEPVRVQKAAKGLVSIARQDILAAADKLEGK